MAVQTASFAATGLEQCSLGADARFGPIISSSCRNFDFTLMFEQSIMSLVPSGVLLLLLPIRLSYLHRSSVKTGPNYTRAIKLVITLGSAALQLAVLILWSAAQSHTTSVITIPSAAISTAAALAICLLAYAEHSRSIRPSTMLITYLLFSIPADALQARTLLLRDDSRIAPVFTAGVVVKFVLLILELQNKTKILKSPYCDLPPPTTSSILDRAFFWWINPVLILGYWGVISYENLPKLDPGLSSARLGLQMEAAWEDRAKPETEWSLLWTITRFLRWPFLSAVLPRACLILFRYSQPWLISRAISHVSGTEIGGQGETAGYVLVLLAVLIYAGISLSSASYESILNRIETMFRGGMVALIYSRSLQLKEIGHDDAAAVTLMSTDIEIITGKIPLLHDLWANSIEVTVGFWLLSKALGWASLVPFLLILSSSKITSECGKLLGVRQHAYMTAKQKRIALTSAMLGSMKSIKMMGLSSVLESEIREQRLDEIARQKETRWIIVLLSTLGEIAPKLAPGATFVGYIVLGWWLAWEPLSTNKAFTTLSIIVLATRPAENLMVSTAMLASPLACIGRIQTFLLGASRKDQRSGENTKGTFNGARYSDTADTEAVNLVDVSAAISISNLTVRPSENVDPALSNVSIRLEAPSINIIAGPIGSGKTTFLRAILGELPFDGEIRVASRQMGYCAQHSWILNGTIRENICGFEHGSEIEEQWYWSVVHACALDQDIEGLPDGDSSLVGSRGVMLSGGQRSRVALARAVYSRLEILLLDDVFSALDGTTEQTLVDRLLGPKGLFRQHKCTVVLVTHSTQHFKFADHIVILNSTGGIAQQGTYETLKSQEGYISGILTRARKTPTPSESPAERSIVKITASKVTEKATDKNATSKANELGIYRYWLNSMSKTGLIGLVVSAAIWSFINGFSQYWLKWWTEGQANRVGLYAGIYMALGVGSSLAEGITISWVMIRLSQETGIALHDKLLGIVMQAPLSFFTETDSGVTLNRFTGDIGFIDGWLPMSGMSVVCQAFSLASKAVLLIAAELPLLATVPFCLAALYIIQKLYLRTSRQMRLLDLEAKAPVYSQFIETLDGLATIRAFNWQAASTAMSIRKLDLSQQPYYLMLCIQRWLALVLDLLVGGLAVLVLFLAVKLRHSTSGGQVGIALNVVMGFNTTLMGMIRNWTMMETSLGAITRLKDFEETTLPEHKSGENRSPSEQWPDHGDIEIRNVTAGYGPRVSVIALRNISMRVLPGQKLGICGRTGSGKSSLLLSVLRLIELSSGQIIIDGYDLSTLPRDVIRQRLITIPQDPFSLSSTIRANLSPSATLPDLELIEVLEKVSLWTLIQARGGLDGNMKSQPLSHGEHQLFCLARAILRKGKVVLLDEATSNVDMETEKVIQRVMKEEFNDRTLLIVAHRLESIEECDVVAVLDQGNLVEFGDPKTLMATEGSAFRKLHQG